MDQGDDVILPEGSAMVETIKEVVDMVIHTTAGGTFQHGESKAKTTLPKILLLPEEPPCEMGRSGISSRSRNLFVMLSIALHE